MFGNLPQQVESATAALGIRERFTKVLHRADCIKGEPVSDGFFETDLRKDLTRITDDLAHTVMVEDFPQTILQRENAMPIRMWIGDPDDEELLELERFIEQIENEPDVRALDLWNWRKWEEEGWRDGGMGCQRISVAD